MDNADIEYKVVTSSKGAIWKTVRGAVTQKRINIGTQSWDRATGERVSAYRPYPLQKLIISYKIDGRETVWFPRCDDNKETA